MTRNKQAPGAKPTEAVMTDVEKAELRRLNEDSQQHQTAWLHVSLSFEYQRREYEKKRATLLDDIERSAAALQKRSAEILKAHKLDESKNYAIDWSKGTIKPAQ
jgi:hypothetical protein